MKTNKILISIKPEYVKKILDRTKRYEFRTIRPKNNFKSIIIYCTYPTKKVLAEVEVDEIIQDTPKNIWKLTKNYAGIDKKKFFEYFKNRNVAYAYKLGKIIKEFDKPLYKFGVTYPPQSFIYISYGQ